MKCSTCSQCGVELKSSTAKVCRSCYLASVENWYWCRHCGKRYKAKRKNRDKYCGRDCSDAAKVESGCRSITIEFVSVCPECGNHTQHPGHYCGDECRKANNNRKIREYSKAKKEATIEARPCKQCGEVFTPEYGDKRRVFCSPQCQDKYGDKWKQRGNLNQRARSVLKKMYGCVPPLMYERIIAKKVHKQSGGVCGICGAPIDYAAKCPDPMSSSIDHIVALANGGTHTYANVQAAHFLCNSLKGASE